MHSSCFITGGHTTYIDVRLQPVSQITDFTTLLSPHLPSVGSFFRSQTERKWEESDK